MTSVVFSILGARVVYRFVFPKPKVMSEMKRKLVSDVIKSAQDAPSKYLKVNILESNMSPALIGILRMNYDENFTLDVDLDIAYKPPKHKECMISMNRAARSWHLFTEDSHLSRAIKNRKFKTMLESLDPREAALFLQAARKEIDIGLTKLVMRRCFAKLLKSRLEKHNERVERVELEGDN